MAKRVSPQEMRGKGCDTGRNVLSDLSRRGYLLITEAGHVRRPIAVVEVLRNPPRSCRVADLYIRHRGFVFRRHATRDRMTNLLERIILHCVVRIVGHLCVLFLLLELHRQDDILTLVVPAPCNIPRRVCSDELYFKRQVSPVRNAAVLFSMTHFRRYPSTSVVGGRYHRARLRTWCSS